MKSMTELEDREEERRIEDFAQACGGSAAGWAIVVVAAIIAGLVVCAIAAALVGSKP